MARYDEVSNVVIKKFYFYLLNLSREIVNYADEGILRYFIMLLYEFIVVTSGFRVHSKSEDEVLKKINLGLSEIGHYVSKEDYNQMRLFMKTANNIRHNPGMSDYVYEFYKWFRKNRDIFRGLYDLGLFGYHYDDGLISFVMSNEFLYLLDVKNERNSGSMFEFKRSVIFNLLKSGESVKYVVDVCKREGWSDFDINDCIVSYLYKNGK